MRSLLFCPADDQKKMTKAFASKADGLIYDLEDSVALDRKSFARECLQEFLTGCDKSRNIWVRINSLDTGLSEHDLEAALAKSVSGVILPKCRTAEDVNHVSQRLIQLEKKVNLQQGSIKILPIATEVPEALFHIHEIAKAAGVWGITWGAEDLAAAIGAYGNKTPDGALTPVFEHARTMCLLAARSAGVEPIDAPSMILNDDAALKAECDRARFDGFSGKLAIHPKQIDAIHAAFTPTADEVQHARDIIEALSLIHI
ncbi:MAG: CoA ester lyase [Kordiimonadaceae bacterium]|nr:CoA ester lyase [Kordiimonadaceae bacterium]